jgi:rhodanese-related sulfurtransferase
MKKKLSILSLAAALSVLFACATNDPSTENIGVTKVDAASAKEMFDRSVSFVDLRGFSYDDGHIPGAVHLDWNKTFSEAELAKVASKNQEVVFYCDGPTCYLSPQASRLAVSWGYQKIHHFRDGFPAWKAAGYPIEQ